MTVIEIRISQLFSHPASGVLGPTKLMMEARPKTNAITFNRYGARYEFRFQLQDSEKATQMSAMLFT